MVLHHLRLEYSVGWRVESRETKLELEYSIKVVDPEIAGDLPRVLELEDGPDGGWVGSTLDSNTNMQQFAPMSSSMRCSTGQSCRAKILLTQDNGADELTEFSQVLKFSELCHFCYYSAWINGYKMVIHVHHLLSCL